MRKGYLTAGGVAALAVFCGGASAPPSAAPAAFPGAAGWGKSATGGRAAETKVLAVTSLEDSGPGTLREALMQSGPRIIVFKTGGVIDLKSKISFQQGDVTIAGQTAPGDGIIIKSFPIRIGASNVIFRGLRIRNGDGPGPKGDLRDSIQLGRADGKPIQNIIIDHCSFGWSVDETGEFWYGAKNVTFSNCIFSEALWKSIHEKGSHGYALLFGNGLNENVTLYRNLFAHNERRNPWIKDNAQVEMTNNVIYNWGTEGAGLWNSEAGKPASSANLINNYFKAGVDSGKRRGINLAKTAAPGSKFFIKGNIGPGRPEDKGDEWDAVGVGMGVDATTFRTDTPLPNLASGVSVEPAMTAYERVLKEAGAFPRDAADKRAVETTRTGTGKHIDKMTDLGGYPTYAPGTPPPDTDNDGIPDTWEQSHSLNPKDPKDATLPSKSGNGYLNIEEYLNSLLPGG
jgi:pectate lyase